MPASDTRELRAPPVIALSKCLWVAYRLTAETKCANTPPI